MKNSKTALVSALALAGALAAGSAQARDVQWSISIGTPALQWHISQPGVHVAVPSYPQYIYYAPDRRERYYAPPTHRSYGHARGRHDRDGDGIPNRYDRVHNPRWDVDGDGIPNRRDRVYNPPWDRDGDGIPNRHDRRPGRR